MEFTREGIQHMIYKSKDFENGFLNSLNAMSDLVRKKDNKTIEEANILEWK
jgi:hypothetical protein